MGRVAGVVCVLAVASTQAFAQPSAQPPVAPAPISAAMAHRWALSVMLGLESMTPKVDNATAVGFVTFELAGRIRAKPSIEFALTLGGMAAFSHSLQGGGGFVDFRYHFMAERPWNVIAIGGLGIVSVHETNDNNLESKARGALRFGAGFERRWDTFALEGDLLLVGIGENKSAPDPIMETVGYTFDRFSVSGLQLVGGATYYF